MGNPIIMTDPTGESADGGGVEIQETANGEAQMVITATVYTYGAASSEEMARDLAHQVNSQWNNNTVASAKAGRTGQLSTMPVVFNIDFKHVSPEQAASLAANNTDPTVNFMKVIDAPILSESDMSQFGGNTGVLNLSQNRVTESTTVAHEIGHMLGFDSGFSDDNTHFTDAALLNVSMNDQSLSGNALPLMYSGGDYSNNLGGRVKTTADIQGLGLSRVMDNKTNYIGEPMTNQLK